MWKLVVIGALVAALQIPVFMVERTLLGRRAYRDEAAREIAASWGGAQTLVGPILVVPCVVETKVDEQARVGERWIRSQTTKQVDGSAWFLPEELAVEGRMDCSERYRGIFRAPVYAARLSFTGRFRPDPEALAPGNPVYDWSKATVLFALSDARGLVRAPVLVSGEARNAFRPGRSREGWPPTIEAALPGASAADLTRAFSFEVDLQGAPRLAITPVGAANTVSLSGNWKDPSFDGNLLPTWREILDTGFEARWESAHFGRGFPQQWSQREGRVEVGSATLFAAASGVTLTDPVDLYRLVERSMKYSLLFVVLIFSVFFLFEVCAPVRMHPLQYLLVGAALTLFYLGFLALGDFVGAGRAYALAAVASCSLVSGYSWSVLKTGSRTALVAAGLLATYGGLYLILRMQDYALLAGAAALFVLLAAIMWFTRRIDWYAREGSASSA